MNDAPLPPVTLPEGYNYIAVFLTLDCTLGCSYCINRFDDLSRRRAHLTGEEWLLGLKRLQSRPDLPLTLQGGEPTLHPDFYRIAGGLPRRLSLDLLTNLQFDIGSFMQAVPPERFKREAPYASIRVSYHPEVMEIEELAAKVLVLQGGGYHIGIWGVAHPAWTAQLEKAKEYCGAAGIDFRVKEFLGEHEGTLHGSIRYPGACDRGAGGEVLCRTSELLIGPGGDIYRCHSDLYAGRGAVGHLLDPGWTIEERFRPCSRFGYCNPCDVKIKTNRHQEFGHTSVLIETQRGGAGSGGAAGKNGLL